MLAYPMSKAALNMLTVQYAKAFPLAGGRRHPRAHGHRVRPRQDNATGQPGVNTAAIIIAMAPIGADGLTGTLVNIDGPVPW